MRIIHCRTKSPENTGSRLRRVGLRFAWPACVVQFLCLSAACQGPDSAPSSSAALRDPSAGIPLVILWAWERPEDLRFVPKERIGVAVLAKTLIVDPNGLTIRPRLQPIRIAPEVTTLAVVRLDASPATGTRLVGETRSRIVEEIVAVSRTPGIAGIQIDFDALKSQRAFYRGLLRELRQKLPSSLKLSITALASWCVFDDWISDLPVDEAVPMLFRLGAGV